MTKPQLDGTRSTTIYIKESYLMNKKFKKLLQFLAMLGILSLLLAACGGSNNQPADNGKPTLYSSYQLAF